MDLSDDCHNGGVIYFYPAFESADDPYKNNHYPILFLPDIKDQLEYPLLD